MLALVKAFLKAGILTELGEKKDTHTGTPQGGILSPLLANIALSVLDEHLHAPWRPGGTMSHRVSAQPAPRQGPTETGESSATPTISSSSCTATGTHVEALREDVADVLAPLGLRLSPAKTQVRAHERRVRLPRLPHPVETQDEERTSGTSTPSSPTGPSGR